MRSQSWVQADRPIAECRVDHPSGVIGEGRCDAEPIPGPGRPSDPGALSDVRTQPRQPLVAPHSVAFQALGLVRRGHRRAVGALMSATAARTRANGIENGLVDCPGWQVRIVRIAVAVIGGHVLGHRLLRPQPLKPLPQAVRRTEHQPTTPARLRQRRHAWSTVLHRGHGLNARQHQAQDLPNRELERNQS